MNKGNKRVYKIVITGLMTALCYVVFTFLKIPIPTFSGDMVVLHIDSALCVLTALLPGGWHSGMVGTLSVAIVNVLDPVYITNAPKTFVLKLCIGLVASSITHWIAKITEDHDSRHIFRWSLTVSIVSPDFNVITDPIVGYFYRNCAPGVKSSAAKVIPTWATGATFINVAAGVIVVVVVHMAMRPVLRRAGLFFRI